MLWKANRWDWLCLMLAQCFGSSMGYYYHGLALGPRHAYEALPFYAILTARGILSQGNGWSTGSDGWKREGAASGGNAAKLANWLLVLVVLVCIGCNLAIICPGISRSNRNFAGLPVYYHLNVEEIYKGPLHQAVVVTDDWFSSMMCSLA